LVDEIVRILRIWITSIRRGHHRRIDPAAGNFHLGSRNAEGSGSTGHLEVEIGWAEAASSLEEDIAVVDVN
jgi:hypothetical protein